MKSPPASAPSSSSKAIDAAAAYRDILGPNNFFLEMQYQGIEEQKIVNVGLQPIAKDLSLQLVATNDVHYLKNSDFKPHDILLCIGTGKTVNDTERLKYHGDQFYLKTADEMAAVFPRLPRGDRPTRCGSPSAATSICRARSTTCRTSTSRPASRSTSTSSTSSARVSSCGCRGCRSSQRQGRAEAHDRRVRAAAHLRNRDDQADEVPGYFLIVWDFIRYAREKGIPVGPGRGSAAGSFVAYCLRITDVDPIEYDLIFERFLNPERVSLPDIDIDFCERRRGEVIEYVTQKYGRENVAQIITFGTMKARAVVRDVARVMDIPYADADRVAKAVPPALDMTLAKALEESPALKEHAAEGRARSRSCSPSPSASKGMTRHASVHAAGVVIAPRPLTEFVPLYKSQKDEIVTQWAMKEVERVGLLKMDFLGLSTLTLIQRRLAEIKRTEGIDLDIDAIPLDDEKTYKLFCRRPDLRRVPVRELRDARAAAQGEAGTARRPDRAERALPPRPAEVRDGGRLHLAQAGEDRGQVRAASSSRRSSSDTYGVIAYQEQVMRIAAVLAGLHDGPVRHAPQGHGEEGPQGHGQAARSLHGRGREERRSTRRRPPRSST